VPLQFRFHGEVTPFSDHFPFNAAGVPSLWFSRTTLVTARHFHHTVLDTPAVVSFDLLAGIAAFEAALVHELAFSARWPFPSRMPPALSAKIRRTAEDWSVTPRSRRPR
jgi:hypothetical protein